MPDKATLLAFEGGSVVSEDSPYMGGTQVSKEDYRVLRAAILESPKNYPLQVTVDSRGERLSIGSFVGVLALRSGKVLEIVPKCYEGLDKAKRSRVALMRMVARSGPLPLRVLEKAAQAPSIQPLHQILVQSFLDTLEKVLVYGLLSSYSSVAGRRRVLKGKLEASKQVRERTPIPLTFQTKAQEYRENRPENRLLRSALDVVVPFADWIFPARIGRILEYLKDIEPSRDIPADFRAWATDRLASRYSPLEPWCRLILEAAAAPLPGKRRLPGLLFPMERLFESYVGSCITEMVPKGYNVVAQSRRRHLGNRDGKPVALLKPDFVIRREGVDISVIDAKWKSLVKEGEMSEASSSDLYQLYAYGRSYLGGKGKMALAIPKTDSFKEDLAPIIYAVDPDLSVRYLPINLEGPPLELREHLSESLRGEV